MKCGLPEWSQWKLLYLEHGINNFTLYSNKRSTRCNVTQFIYICKLLYIFQVVFPPIIRSTHNCIHSIWYMSDSYCYLPLLRQVAVMVWQIPDAVDTVVCAPDDGWRYHPKHVEQFTDIIKLRNIASCWTFMGKYLRRKNPWTLILPSTDIMSEFQSLVLVHKSSYWYFLSVVISWYRCEFYCVTCFRRSHFLLCERMDVYLTSSAPWTC